MNKKINLIHLISGLGSGGAEKMLLDLSREFAKNHPVESSVISFSGEVELLSEFEKSDIKVTVLNRKKRLSDLLQMIKEISTYIKAEKIDVVHAHMSHAMIAAAILKLRYPQTKVVFTQHNINIGSILRELLIFLLKPFRQIDILFSKDMHRWFNKRRYATIPNGVPMEEFSMRVAKFDTFTFLSVGNIKEAKNYPFLIECAYRLKQQFNFHLLIMGEGKEKGKLEEMVQEKNLEKQVFILGHQDNIAEYMNRSHCLVLPSLWEGLPVSILEAGAAKLPVISTKVGAIPSVLCDKCAYLTNLDDFENTMSHVIQNYPEAEQKAERFYEKVEKNYTIDRITRDLEELYGELVRS